MPVEPTLTNRFLQSILECVGVGIIVTDQDGQIQLFNPEAEAILGPNLLNTKAENWSRTHGIYKSEQEERLSEEENPFFNAMRGATVSKAEVFVRNNALPLGAWCDINVRPLMDDNNKQSGGIIVIENVTERKKLSVELQRSNRDLQEFAYVAAHDLQEPLRTIIGFGELLEAGTREILNEKSSDHLRRMLAAARRMQILIAAVLKFARVETKAKPPVVCDTRDIIEDAINDLHSTIHQTEAVFNIDVRGKIVVDRVQATQLFQNIIANAVKYRSDKKPVIEITSQKRGILTEFRVCDNGIGFDITYAEKIFVLFKRLHNRDKYDGAGVGLAVCKKIVERHGGAIRADSTPGNGACFYFTLPRAVAEEN